MLVGNSLLDYLQGDTTDEGATSETVNTNSDEDDEDEKTLLSGAMLERSSTSTSRTSNKGEDPAKSSDSIKPRRTGLRTSRPSLTTSPLGSGIEPGSPSPVIARSTHRVTIGGRASISDFRPSDSRKKSSQSIQEDLDEDDEALIDAIRPPASSAGAEIINTADFMQDQLAHNCVDEYEGENGGSIKEIREKRKTVSTDEENSDTDGPPSDFNA